MANEIRLIDANAAIEALAANFRQASADGCDNPFYQIAADTISEMQTVCVDHFHNTAKMVQLTLEQLREMEKPTPVWAEMEEKTIEAWDGYWCICHRGHIITPGLVSMYADKMDGVTFYTYPPVHIDRDGWTAEWIEDGECNHKPYRVRDAEKWKKYRCSKCGYKAGRTNNKKFCPSCGRPMTQEAITELEKWLRKPVGE